MAAQAPISHVLLSDAQLEANRDNAQKSTGPRTPEGKRRSSLNAVKLGIYSQTLLLPGEDAQAYAGLFAAFVDQLHPDGPIEMKLVESVAQTQWRLDRCARIESSVFAQAFVEPDPNPGPGLLEGQVYLEHHRAIEALSRQTARLHKVLASLLQQLAAIQAARRAQWEREMREAVDTCIYMEDNGKPFEPAEHGFDFSKEQVERLANRKRGQGAIRQFHSDIAAITKLRAVDRLTHVFKETAA